VTETPDSIHTLVRHMNVGLLVVDAQLVVSFWNRFLEVHSGLPSAAVLGRSLFDSFPEVNRPWLERKVRSVFMLRNFSFTSWRDRPYLLKFAVTRPATGGSDVMRQDCTFIALRKPDGSVDEVAIVIVDVTENFLGQQALDAAMLELRKTHEQLHREIAERQVMEVELRKSQRLEAVEHLAGGVAHELNTPLQVMSSATSFLREGAAATLGLIDRYAALSRTAGVPEPEIEEAEQTAELPFWREELPRAFERIEDSIERAARIVQTLKAFCGANAGGRRDVNLNTLVQEAVQFATPLYQGFADLQLALTDLPVVNGAVGSLGQVLLSLITNAAQAVEKSTAGGQRGKIRVTTSFEDGEAVVAVSDSGTGIPEAIRSRIFDLFFTTKDVGTGVGAGLALAYATVTKEHGGKLTFTTGGEGTTFFVRLPIAASASASAAD
jgi:two-component system, NtrC family, sensor kinase